jgi:hypothetical protein
VVCRVEARQLFRSLVSRTRRASSEQTIRNHGLEEIVRGIVSLAVRREALPGMS